MFVVLIVLYVVGVFAHTARCTQRGVRFSALFKVEQTEHSEYTDYTRVTNNTFRLNTHRTSEMHTRTPAPVRLYVFNSLGSSDLL